MNQHIVKAYDQDLQALHGLIRHMGELTIDQVRKATKSLVDRDGKLAHLIIEKDYEIDLLETKVDTLVVRILALRQPVASDLRMVIAALKIANQVERIADYACNIAKRSLLLNEMPPFSAVEGLLPLVKLPVEMIAEAMRAFETNDVNLALHVWNTDFKVDELYNVYLHHLFEQMIADVKNVGPCTHLLFAAKNIERIGDQATNIAEAIYAMVTGRPFKESEAKSHEV